MNWKQAFSLGLLAPGEWGGRGEPVAYLYNGVRLPKLPETDLPYKVIGHNSGGVYRLYAAEAAAYSDITVMIPVPCLYWYRRDGKNSWTFGGEITNASGAYFHAENCDWANHDILNNDGSVFLPASDPVPVYE